MKICSNSECSLCYTEDTCQNCVISYYSSNNKCLVCDDNCKSCDKNAKYCTSCKNKMYLDI